MYFFLVNSASWHPLCSLLNPISLKFFEIAGSYAEYSVVPVEKLVKVPSNISFEQAATSMIQGLTAHYLTHSCYPVGPGTKVLVHAAAGGTGSLICQVAKNAGNDNRKIFEQSFLNVNCKGAWWFRGEGCTRVQLWLSYWKLRIKQTKKLIQVSMFGWREVWHFMVKFRTWLTVDSPLSFERLQSMFLESLSQEFHRCILKISGMKEFLWYFHSNETSLELQKLTQIFQLPHTVALEPYIRVFQYKVLNGILDTSNPSCMK